MGDYERDLGHRIARQRRLRGLSQAELARRISRSVAWVSQVERGVRRIDRMSVLESVADALGVPVADLAAESPMLSSASANHAEAARLRLILAAAHPLRAVLAHGTPLDVADLQHRVEQVWDLVHDGTYVELPAALEGLLPQLEAGSRAGDDREQVSALLASAYHALAAALSKLREPDAAWVATDRAIHAAERSGDPLLMAAGTFRLVVAFQGAGQHAEAEQTARTAADALEAVLDRFGDPARSLWSVLTLQRAVTAARTDDAGSAYALLDQARAVADALGEGRNDYHTEFSPTNVSIHEVAVAADLGDASRALRVAAGIDSSGLSAERRTRLLIDVARAHSQRREPDLAVRSLLEAERLSPAIVHEHRFSRQILTDLLATSDTPSDDLRGLAERSGVLPS